MSYKPQTTLRRLFVMANVIFQWQLASAAVHFQGCDFVVSYIMIFLHWPYRPGVFDRRGVFNYTIFNICYVARFVRVKDTSR